MYPPIEPFKTGHLSVTDGNEIYWEISGNPNGQPALFLHGGPGGGLKSGYRRRFDPEKFLIVSFEQRGCGRSKPTATPANLHSNTTQKLISDIEALRKFLQINRWLVTGVSWGTTLALAYAVACPDQVTAIVLAAVTTTSPKEVKWITEDMGKIFPQEWDAFVNAVEDFPGKTLIDRYYYGITYPDIEVQKRIAQAWCQWEDAHPSLDPNYSLNTDFNDINYCLQFALLVIHYWRHHAFMQENKILSKLNSLKNVSAVLIHGKYDVSSPLKTAWDLHKGWPSSQFIVIEDEGHGGPKIMQAMADAISKFADVR